MRLGKMSENPRGILFYSHCSFTTLFKVYIHNINKFQ